MLRRGSTTNNRTGISLLITSAIFISLVKDATAFVPLPSQQRYTTAPTRQHHCPSLNNRHLWPNICASQKIIAARKECIKNSEKVFRLFSELRDDSSSTDNSANDDSTESVMSSSSEQKQQKDQTSRSTETEGDILTKAAAFVTRSSLPSTLLGTKTIGVDYGLVRTGVAATVGYDPRPLTILSSLNQTETASAVVQICRDEKAERVVLGLPLHKNGTEAEQSNLTRAFGAYLSCACYAEFGPNVPVYLWDERYSSKEAAARVRSCDPSATDLYGELDADAACIILEHYYADGGMRRIGDDKTERLEAELVPVPEAMKDTCEAAWEAKRAEREREKEEMMKERLLMLNSKQAAMERAKALEKKMELDGTLGLGRKKAKKKKKKKRKKDLQEGIIGSLFENFQTFLHLVPFPS